MGLFTRVQAAFNAFAGKAPSGKAEQLPFFYGYSGINQPTPNMRVNPQRLRAFSETAIVRHAVDYIRNQVSKLDWDIQPKSGKKFTAVQKKQVETFKNVLNKPNTDDNFMTFLGQLVEDMLVIGSGAFEIKKWVGNKDNPIILYPVDAASIQIYLDWNGSPNTRRYAQLDLQGRQIDFTPQEMVVMRHVPRTNTPFGFAPVEAAYQQIQYFLDAQSYAGKTASNATPKKLIFMGKEITDPQLKEFRAYWQEAVEGRSSIPIIGGTDDVRSVELGKADDAALFLQWQSFLVAVIANAFGLDAMKFNAYITNNSRSNGETMDTMSEEGAIQPMAHSIEHYMNQLLYLFDLDGVAEFKFRFTTSFGDRKALGAVHQIYAQLDVYTINEIRQEIGLEPLPIDPETGKSMGDLTVSAYRAKYGSPPPLTPENSGASDPESAKGDANGDTTKTGNEAANNGVNGAKKPTDSSLSKNKDKDLTT